MKSIEQIQTTDLNPNDELAEFLYKNIYARDHRGAYREWSTAIYQAPETREGFAYRLCLVVADEIRSKFSVAQTTD